MRRFLRLAGIAVGSLVVLAVLALAAVWILSERALRRTWLVPLDAVVFNVDSSALAEGERLARLRGCWDGCHGPGAAGEVFVDEPGVVRLVAPDLTKAVRRMTDAELARLVRHGVRADGTGVFAMPSDMLRHLGDAELGAIIAFLRSVPPTDGPDYALEPRILGRIGVVAGQLKAMPEIIATLQPPVPPAPAGSVEQGMHLVMSVCSECHGADARGSGNNPDLAVAASYTEDQFRTLMRTGVPPGGRDLGLMKDVALSRFSHFTDDEVTVIYRYLRSLTE